MPCTNETDWFVMVDSKFCSAEHRWRFISTVQSYHRMHPTFKIRFIDYKRHFVLIKLYNIVPKYCSDFLDAKKFSDFSDFVSSTDAMSCTTETDWLVMVSSKFSSAEHRWQFISMVRSYHRRHPTLKIRFIDHKRHFVLIKHSKIVPKHRTDLLGAKKYWIF